MKKYLKHVNQVMEMSEDIHKNNRTTPFSCEVITETAPKIMTQRASGWGDTAQSTTIDGIPMKFTVIRDGKPSFSVRICETGRLIFTSYDGSFEFGPVRNLDLEPTIPWKT